MGFFISPPFRHNNDNIKLREETSTLIYDIIL